MRRIILLALMLCLLPITGAAENEWQSGEATSLVRDLLGSISRIVELSPGDDEQPDTVLSKKSHAALVDLRVMEEELRQLELALASGSGKPQTLAQYQRVSNLRFSVQDYGGDIELSEEIRKEAAVAVTLLRKLDLMYAD